MKKAKNQEPECGKKVRCKSLIIHGEKYMTLYTRKFENRKKWQQPDHKKISSILPGTVIQLFVKPGDEVMAEDKIFILEAMKMRNTYYFPVSGRIKQVNAKVGDKIPKGFLVVEYE